MFATGIAVFREVNTGTIALLGLGSRYCADTNLIWLLESLAVVWKDTTDLELDDLTAFLAVVEHGGFRKAASTLGITQPALSRRVARLERETGVELLHRGAHGARATPQGEILASGARRLASTLSEIQAAGAGMWSETIVIACTALATQHYLADFLAEWVPKHPDTRVKLAEDSPAVTRRRLVEGSCDLALVASPLEQGIASLPVSHSRLIAMLPASHRLASNTTALPIAELANEPLLLNGEQYLSARMLAAAGTMAQVPLRVIFECTVGNTLAALVRVGVGIAVISDAMYEPHFELPKRVIVDPSGNELGFDMHIAWSRDRKMNPVVFEFAEELSAFAQSREVSG